jgi:hypothetical protein
MNAALRFRLVAAILLLGAVGLFNALDTGRALGVSQWLIAGAALVASGLALMLARWTQRGDPGAPPRWRVEMLTIAFAIPLVPVMLTLLPWFLILLNQTPRSFDAVLVGREPVKGCALKVWLSAPPGDSGSPVGALRSPFGDSGSPFGNSRSPFGDGEQARCLDGVIVAGILRAGEPVRVVGRESWAGFVMDRLEK